MLGGFDFVSLVEAPDNETVAYLSVDLGSRGTVIAELKGPKQMGHK